MLEKYKMWQTICLVSMMASGIVTAVSLFGWNYFTRKITEVKGAEQKELSEKNQQTILDSISAGSEKVIDVLKKIQVQPEKASEIYAKTDLVGEAAFDYSNNNGLYNIGKDEYFFTTAWSKASDRSIHVYNDHIAGVALALGTERIDDIGDPNAFDFSSRTRTPQTGEIVVLKNRFGNYAVLQIMEIKDRTRQGNVDFLRFKYIILTKTK